MLAFTSFFYVEKNSPFHTTLNMEKSSLIFKTVKVQNTSYEKIELIFQSSTGDQEVSELSNNIIGQF